MKNLKGGYQLVDLEKNDLSSSFTLEGLYETITLSNNKSLLVTGIVISGTKKNDVYTTVEKSGDDYTFTIYGKTLTISDGDAVTVSSASQGGTQLYKHTINYENSNTSEQYKFVIYNLKSDVANNTNKLETAFFNMISAYYEDEYGAIDFVTGLEDSGSGHLSVKAGSTLSLSTDPDDQQYITITDTVTEI